jgi:drug/metabolite transporter (DMT)-like permease
MPVPSNQANDIYSSLVQKIDTASRTIDQVTVRLESMTGITGGVDYEKLSSARLLSSSEYTVNTALGYISLKSGLQTDQVLAVAYEYTYGGQTYQVGEFSTDMTQTDKCLFVKALKNTSNNPSQPNWRLMMKNVYYLASTVEKEKFRVRGRELGLLALLGVLCACSSIFLFASYTYIPSVLATTLVYLYPVFVALLMVFLRFYPSWQTWLSIAATFGGILLLSSPSPGAVIRVPGVILAILSALSYAFYLVIINRSGRIKHVSEHTLTLYALLAGMLLFAILRAIQGGHFAEGIDTPADWANLLGLALVPTMISMLTLAISTRFIGPTKTSVLGVFEPLTAILVGTLLFGEPLTWKMAVGIAVCVGAVVFMILKPGVNTSAA